MSRSRNFVFDGGLADYLETAILAALLTVFTLGLAFPWALCMNLSWRAKHTIVSGRRLEFTGTGGDLIGLWLKWIGLTIITLGIYLFWVSVSLERWIVEHTDFADGQQAYQYPRPAPPQSVAR